MAMQSDMDTVPTSVTVTKEDDTPSVNAESGARGTRSPTRTERTGRTESRESTRARRERREHELIDTGKFFYEAVICGDVGTVREVIDANSDLDIDSTAYSDEKKNALEEVSTRIRSDWELLQVGKLLVAKGATITTRALESALTWESIDLAILFLERSRNMLDFANSFDKGTLGGHQYVTWFLDIFSNPERVNNQDPMGNTALHHASEYDRGGYVEWLLNQNPLPSKENFGNETAWEAAVKNSSFDAIGAFAFKEMEHQRNTQGSNGTGIHFYVNGREKKKAVWVQNSWHHIGGSNSKILIYGYLTEFARCRDNESWNPREIIRMVDQEFREDNTINTFLSFREPSCIVDNNKKNISELPAIENGPRQFSFVSLVMPFFYSTSLATIEEEARKEKFDELTQYRYCLGKGGELGVHLPLTMDEYCNPSLDSEILAARNKDQVVHRYLSEKAKTPYGPESRSVITVPQAWIWKINDAVFTSSPSGISPDDFIVDGMRNNRWYLFDGDYGNYKRPGDIELSIGIFLSDLVDVLDRTSMAGLPEPIFNIFEKAISAVSEDVNEYTEDTHVDTIDINKERKFLHVIDDIREELSMISTILFQQEEVWKDFTNKTWPQYWPDGPDGRFQPPERPKGTDDDPMRLNFHQEIWAKIQKPQIQFAKFKRRISKLDADAERVARAIDRKLDLKATHASLKETHATAIMSAAVFGFTIITIIFTPLSFIVSLFALPIDRFQRDQAGMYSTNYVGKWIATVELISVALTLALMWLMIHYGLDVRITKKTWGWATGWAKGLYKRMLPCTAQGESGTKTPRTSMTAANVKKCDCGKQPGIVVAESSINQSKPEHGSKKRQARNWKWLGKREIQSQDVENVVESEK